MSSVRWDRIAAASGVVFVVLVLVGSFLPPQPPMPGDGRADIADYFAADRGRILTGNYLQALAGIPFVLFLAGFIHSLRRAEGEPPVLSSAAYASGLIAGAAFTLLSALTAALSYSRDTDAATVELLYNFIFVSTGFAGILIAAFVAASSVVILQTGVLAKWLGWGGLVDAILWVVGAGGFATDGFFVPGGPLVFASLLLFAAYVLVASVMMLMHQRATTTMPRMAHA